MQYGRNMSDDSTYKCSDIGYIWPWRLTFEVMSVKFEFRCYETDDNVLSLCSTETVLFNPFKPSAVEWLHLKASRAIHS